MADMPNDANDPMDTDMAEELAGRHADVTMARGATRVGRNPDLSRPSRAFDFAGPTRGASP